MAETYDITYSAERVGTAQMEKQGLYCSFSCRCQLPEEGLYRIHVICGENREDLGICIPMDGAFGMVKRIPAKRVGEGRLFFELVPKDWQPPAEVIPETAPVLPEEETLIPVPLEEDSPALMQPEELPAAEPMEETFIPVSEEEPFEHLDKLQDAVMDVRNDQPGILVRGVEE